FRAPHHHLGGGHPVGLRHLPLAKHGYELAVHALSGNSHRSARVARTDGPPTHRARSRIVPGRRVSRPREASLVMEQDYHEDAGGVPRGAMSGGGAPAGFGRPWTPESQTSCSERVEGRATRTRGRAPTAGGRHCRRSAAPTPPPTSWAAASTPWTVARRRAPQRWRHWRICSACSR